ncbi:transcriptional regulator [Arthrobacter liuii]|uniref:Transcriptional regulator n=1 Tax=Arthrobacter liuii TaxID=1476996 RepID=A0ABQ2B0K5_9MICC|nr:transcriptional regulator [Arthrobacter liuii]
MDGRTARARRTLRIISDAHIGLINDGELKPSAKQIAARAGVSVRALWDHFKDMEALMASTAARQLAEQDEAFNPVPVGLPLAERVAAYSWQRAEILEAIAPLARAADLQRPFSEALQQNLQENLNRIRNDVERLFEAELAGLDRGHRTRTVLSICAASDWANWKLLRDSLGQSVEEARAVVENTLTALLEGPTTGPENTRKQNP